MDDGNFTQYLLTFRPMSIPLKTLAPTHQMGMILTDCFFEVPLDHARPAEEKIALYGRAVRDDAPASASKPWLVFLQGGPGFAAPRPLSHSGWLKRALRDYQVLLLDTRGNGRSTPVLRQTLMALADDRTRANYLKHFRADAIVKDCELIRAQITGGSSWSLLGQSYGGFCAVSYLSFHPEGLREVYITGGLPPLTGTADDYYRATYPLQAARNRRWLERWPEDAALATQVMEFLRAKNVPLPGGGRLTVERFQTAGLQLGFSDGAETIHYLLEKAFVDGAQGSELSYPFLRACENLEGFQTHPIYALLHEQCYTQQSASRWAAHRVRADFPAFNFSPQQPPYLTGEMIYPWLFEQLPELIPLRGTAELIASDADWPLLYDAAALARNTVPAAAAIYVNDPYVPRCFSEPTAAAIQGLKPWITNEHEHDGLRQEGEKILGRLIDLVNNRA